MVGGVDIPFADFIAPGLIISQGMMGPAFANASFSLLVGKIQGTIVDYLMPPLSTMELLAALVGGAMTRAFIVGFICWAAMAMYGVRRVRRSICGRSCGSASSARCSCRCSAC